MDGSYALTPFLAWLVAGVTKFIVNSIKARQWAFGLIGYGGLPSNHSAIVSSMAALIALKEGIGGAFTGTLDHHMVRPDLLRHGAWLVRHDCAVPSAIPGRADLPSHNARR